MWKEVGVLNQWLRHERMERMEGQALEERERRKL